MKNLKIYKKVLALITTTSIAIALPSLSTREDGKSHIINQDFTSANSDVPFAFLDNYKIYITNKDRSSLTSDDANSIYIIDERFRQDPNICIMESYKIVDREDMQRIIAILQEYERKYPSNWKRSEQSLLNEWLVHNLCSGISFRKSHTDDVDFNNADEKIYKEKILTHFFGN